jgi:hypothetical protein
MAITSTITRDNLRAYLDRNWVAAKTAKTRFISNQIAKYGASQAMRYMDTLRFKRNTRPDESQQAETQSTAQDRSQDFKPQDRSHPLSDLLRCIANAFEQVSATWFVFGAQAKLEK